MVVRGVICFCYLIYTVKSQFFHDFHIKENTVIYKTILNIKQLLILKNKIETSKVKESKVYINSIINKGLFTLDSESNLKVTRYIDREEICPPQELIKSANLCGSVTVCCHVLEFNVAYKNEDMQSYFLKVFIDDENDNTPLFPSFQSPYSTIEENKPIGHKLALPKAKDADSEGFGIAFYKLQTPFLFGNSSDFDLSQDSKETAPFLVVAAPLDREKTPKYTFILIAVDGLEGNRNTGQTEITIKIRDINDNAPKFERHIYLTKTKEHSSPDPLFDILVTDEDDDDNGRLELNMVDGENAMINRYFSLDITDNTIGRLRAQIRTTVPLDYEQQPNVYEFKLIAKDKGRNPLSSTATVRVQVLNVNDNSPEIHFVRNGKQISTSFAIVEGTPSNVMLAHVQVSDVDSPLSQLQCSLVSSESILMLEESRFRHPGNQYKQYYLRTTRSIDRENILEGMSDSKISVTVQCFDNDIEKPLSSKASIFILIDDINDNQPIFSLSTYNGYVDENLVNYEIFIQPPVVATDKDKSINGKISYYLKDEANKSDSLCFRIDSDTGKIFNIQSFDFEKRSLYSFLIVAQDQGVPTRLSASAQVTVRIRDKNDNAPKFTKSHFSFSVSENVPLGSVIGVVNATDRDTLPDNRIVRYYMKKDAQNRESGYVSIDAFNGNIRTRQLIDREKISSITFIIEARNPSPTEGDLLQEAMVVITILDVNDNPPVFRFIDPSKTRVVIYLEVLEQSPVCEPLPVVVQDPDDSGKTVSCCNIRLKKDYGRLLTLSNESQTIICVNSVPVDIRNIQVTLIATDKNGNHSLNAEGTFTIVLKNDPNIMSKSKLKTTNDVDKKPQHRKEDIRQITLVTILASLAGICLLIIIVIIIISQKKCGRLDLDQDGMIREKNNNNSQPMLDLHCNIQKNDLETAQFIGLMSSGQDNYYSAMQPIYPVQSMKTSQRQRYDKLSHISLDDEYTRTIQMPINYQNLQQPDDSYQMLTNRLTSYNQLSDNIPIKGSEKLGIDSSNPEFVSFSASVSPPESVSLGKSISRYNQSSFV